MTKHFRAALLIAVLTLSLLTGCAVQAKGPDRTPAVSQEVPAASVEPSQALTGSQDVPEPSRNLTAEEAQAIALEHAGFTADQVRFLRTEPELRDRVPHYDVEFAEGRWEYEYEIHAETGAVLSFEKDD